MLAQNFKTAGDLRISNEEHAALVMVLRALERDELQHLPGGHIRVGVKNGFSMNTLFLDVGNCGTLGCMLGWARRLGNDCRLFKKVDMIRYVSEAPSMAPLFDLFMFCVDDVIRRHVTTEQAACALRNYLTLGEANWGDVIATA